MSTAQTIKPQGKVNKTEAVFTDNDLTFNNPGVSFNEPGVTFGGSDPRQDTGPIVMSAKQEVPVNTSAEDL